MTNKKKYFTILEVTVALAILAMGLTGLMSLTASSKKRAVSGYDNWLHQHILAQAAEFYLLTGNEEAIPENIFPYENYSVSCNILEIDDLPEEMETTIGDWQIIAYKITLFDETNDEIDSITVEKIIKQAPSSL